MNVSSESSRIHRVTGPKVVDAVSQVESTLCEEVFTAYPQKEWLENDDGRVVRLDLGDR